MRHLALILACAALALPAADGDDQGRHSGQVRQKILERFDADHDGKLSESERTAARNAFAERCKERHPELFAKIDTNGDGQLSQEEAQAARERFHDRRRFGHRQDQND
jgi:hypothetical protein